MTDSCHRPSHRCDMADFSGPSQILLCQGKGGRGCCVSDERILSALFEKEVMAHVSEEERVFLIRSVLLETLSSDTCDFVLGITNSARILDGLSRRGLFVYFDRNDRAFHCDSYMRRYLLDELLEGHRNEIFELSDRASRWFGARGYREEQAKYIIATCDPLYIMGTVSGSAACRWTPKMTTCSPMFSPSRPILLRMMRFCAGLPYGHAFPPALWMRREIGSRRSMAGRCDGRPPRFAFADALCLALEGDRTGSLLRYQRGAGR